MHMHAYIGLGAASSAGAMNSAGANSASNRTACDRPSADRTACDRMASDLSGSPVCLVRPGSQQSWRRAASETGRLACTLSGDEIAVLAAATTAFAIVMARSMCAESCDGDDDVDLLADASTSIGTRGAIGIASSSICNTLSGDEDADRAAVTMALGPAIGILSSVCTGIDTFDSGWVLTLGEKSRSWRKVPRGESE